MDSTSYKAVAHSGSSYISGHPECAKHLKMSFTNYSMTIGNREGDGLLVINFVYECTLDDHSCTKDSKIVNCFDGFYKYENKCVSFCPSGYIAIDKECVKCDSQCATCKNSVSSCTSCLKGYLYNSQCVSECPPGTISTGKSCEIKSLFNESKNITLKSGRYRVKCYGAQGGESLNFSTPFKKGGKGAYVSGIMTVNGTETMFYINIGKMGGSSTNEISLGGSNGGGNGGKFLGANEKGISSSGGGGGSTDLRIYDNSTRNRIIVASGGSGAVFGCQGAPGGTLTGMIAVGIDNFTESDKINQNPREPIEVSLDGLDAEIIPQSGGGGGYFGGLTSNQIGEYENESWKSVSESGNSYLSGYEGCVKHSFMIFEEGEMIGGYNDGDGKVEIETIFECPSNCYSCTSQDKCTKCFENYFLFNEGKECVLKCPVGYTEYNGECVKCASPCDKCSSTPTNCTSCIDGYNLYQNTCISSCPSGTYSVGILPAGLECQNCFSSCLTCTITYDHCTSCIEGYYLLNNSCVEMCPDGTVASGNICVSCDSKCSKCIKTQSRCVECKSGYYLNGNTCERWCPTGTTESSLSCIPCESTNECTSSISSINKNQKFTLKSGVYEVRCYGGQGGNSFITNITYKTGGYGAYAYGIIRIEGNGTIFYSNPGKQGKSSINLTNIGGAGGGGNGGKYTGSDTMGVSSSGGGGGASDLRIYDNSTSNRIIVAAGGSGAAYGCAGAPGGELTGMYPTSNDYFKNSSSVNQNSGVSTGIGQTGYSSSYIPQSGAGGGYRGGVKANSYGMSNTESWKSVSHSGSSYISGYTGCKAHSMTLTNGFMKNGYNSGNGYISIKAKYECSYKCESCTSSSVCTKCSVNYLLYKKRCVDSCPSDSTQVNGICELCNSLCLTCKGSATTCTSCKITYFLYLNQCLRSCPPGYIGLNRVCQKCAKPCSTCAASQTKCTSCEDGYKLHENKCIETCTSTKYFEKNGLCQKCLPPCDTCTSESFCLTCQENYYLYENKCIKSCPEGYIEVNMKCEKCISPCKTCIFTQEICTSCEAGFYLYKAQCLELCPNGTININNICETCILPCDTCQTSQVKCYSCIKGYYFHEGKCEKCDEMCESCSNTKENCDTCSKDMFFYQHRCYAQCDEIKSDEKEYFGKDLENQECLKCSDPNCIECSSNYLICNSCREYYHIENKRCVRDPTFVFTNSRKFSDSNLFTKSSPFSETLKFTQTSPFSESSHFTGSFLFTVSHIFSRSKPFSNSCLFTSSSKFTFSSYFSETSKFTRTSPFSESSHFSKSFIFAASHVFTQSKQFSNSYQFTSSSKFSQSSIFSCTHEFTESSYFSKSLKFTPSSKFTMSLYFDQTSPFTPSSTFTPSMKFTQSSYFTFSHEFTKSFPFTVSHNFLQTKPFTNSFLFSSSSKFTQTSPFSASSLFTESFPFTASHVFTQSKQFSNSYQFTSSSKFSQSSIFSCTHAFTESSYFSKSLEFTPSSKFTMSLYFDQTSPFTPSSTFTPSMQFTQSSYFTFSHEFTKSAFPVFKSSSQFTKPESFTNMSDFSFVFESFKYDDKSHEFTKSSPFTKSNLFDCKHSQSSRLSSLSSTLIAFESPISSELSNDHFFIADLSIEMKTVEIGSSKIIVRKPTNEIEVANSTPKKTKTSMIVGISIAILIVVIATLIAIIIMLKKKKKQVESTGKTDGNERESDVIHMDNLSSISKYQDDTDRDLDFWL